MFTDCLKLTKQGTMDDSPEPDMKVVTVPTIPKTIPMKIQSPWMQYSYLGS